MIRVVAGSAYREARSRQSGAYFRRRGKVSRRVSQRRPRVEPVLGDRGPPSQPGTVRFLLLCGSLRSRSSNLALLNAWAQLVSPENQVDWYEGLAALPHFNPDLDTDNPNPEVGVLRQKVSLADAMVISTPEYAHGLPGTLKNALDWLVSEPAFPGKPVAILHLARGSTWALDSLQEVLKTMSAIVIKEAFVSLSLGTNLLDPQAILARDDCRAALKQSVDALAEALREAR
jgi:chromate reductase, NAD(P)H dehydrogenase (quinone)